MCCALPAVRADSAPPSSIFVAYRTQLEKSWQPGTIKRFVLRSLYAQREALLPFLVGQCHFASSLGGNYHVPESLAAAELVSEERVMFAPIGGAHQ